MTVIAMPAVLLTVEEAAELLRVGRTTVYALIKRGELNARHIGKSTRIHPDDLRAYANNLPSTATANLPLAA